MLPYLAHGNAAAQAALLDHYAGCLDLTALDAVGPDTPPHQVTLNVPPCSSLSDLVLIVQHVYALKLWTVMNLKRAVTWDLGVYT